MNILWVLDAVGGLCKRLVLTGRIGKSTDNLMHAESKTKMLLAVGLVEVNVSLDKGDKSLRNSTDKMRRWNR